MEGRFIWVRGRSDTVVNTAAGYHSNFQQNGDPNLRNRISGVLQKITMMAEAHNAYIAPQSRIPQLQRRFCVTYRAGSQPIGRKLSLFPQTLDYDQTAIRSPGMPFNGLHPVFHGLLLIYRPQRNGRLSWPGWPIAKTLPMKGSHVNHRSDISGRVVSLKIRFM